MLKMYRLLALVWLVLALASTAAAQTPPEKRWSADFGIGFDNGISGNINSGAIGTFNGQTTVILRQKYEDVYGTGLHIRFGGGYMFREDEEFRVHLTIQSLDADLVHLGDYGPSNLYGQYDDYQSMSLDFGYRTYFPLNEYLRGYGEGLIGIAFVDETDVVLAAPQSGLTGRANDFYDRTAAFALSGNIGVMYPAAKDVDIFAQIGLRYVTGMSEVDAFEGTGLETINTKSARWSLPISVGARIRF